MRLEGAKEERKKQGISRECKRGVEWIVRREGEESRTVRRREGEIKAQREGERREDETGVRERRRNNGTEARVE